MASQTEYATPGHGEFEDVADYYDLLMRTVPYARWVDYIESILRRWDAQPAFVLDLCCGTGNHLARLLRSIPDAEAIGADLSPAMLRVARRKCRRHGRVRWLCGDACRALASLAPESLDVIVMCNGFYPQPDKASLLGQVRRVLAPRGTFVLTDPHAGASLFALLREHARAAGPIGLHVLPLLLASSACSLLVQGNAAQTFLSPAAARDLLSAAGLTIHAESRSYAGANYLLTARRAV